MLRSAPASFARLLLACLLAGATLAAAADKPHVIYLLADDLGWRDVGFHGGEAKTPNLDRLAEAGAALNAFYVQPYSSQTRAAALTGRYPMRYGLQTLSIGRASSYGLPAEERTLAQQLKDAGYRTGYVGEWLLGHARPEYWPTRRGFDSFYGSLAGTPGALLHKGGKPDWRRGERPVPEAGYVTDLLAREAATLIRKHDAAAPLFLMVAFNAPARHAEAPPAMLDAYRQVTDDTRRSYLAAVSQLDAAVGTIVAALEERRLLDRTLIVFHSDNGGAVPTRFPTGDADVRRAAADNGVFREGRGSLHEGGVRAAALMHWPGRIAPRTVITAPLHVTDVHAALLGLAGVEPDPKHKLDGIDLWPAVAQAKRSARQEVLLNVDEFHGALRVGEWKLIVHAALPARVQLFDVANDPEEAENKASVYPDRVRELLERLNAHAYEMAPSLYLESLGPGVSPALWLANPPSR
jgi:arylsulfatase A-like enzyme